MFKPKKVEVASKEKQVEQRLLERQREFFKRQKEVDQRNLEFAADARIRNFDYIKAIVKDAKTDAPEKPSHYPGVILRGQGNFPGIVYSDYSPGLPNRLCRNPQVVNRACSPKGNGCCNSVSGRDYSALLKELRNFRPMLINQFNIYQEDHDNLAKTVSRLKRGIAGLWESFEKYRTEYPAAGQQTVKAIESHSSHLDRIYTTEKAWLEAKHQLELANSENERLQLERDLARKEAELKSHQLKLRRVYLQARGREQVVDVDDGSNSSRSPPIYFVPDPPVSYIPNLPAIDQAGSEPFDGLLEELQEAAASRRKPSGDREVIDESEPVRKKKRIVAFILSPKPSDPEEEKTSTITQPPANNTDLKPQNPLPSKFQIHQEFLALRLAIYDFCISPAVQLGAARDNRTGALEFPFSSFVSTTFTSKSSPSTKPALTEYPLTPAQWNNTTLPVRSYIIMSKIYHILYQNILSSSQPEKQHEPDSEPTRILPEQTATEIFLTLSPLLKWAFDKDQTPVKDAILRVCDLASRLKFTLDKFGDGERGVFYEIEAPPVGYDGDGEGSSSEIEASLETKGWLGVCGEGIGERRTGVAFAVFGALLEGRVVEGGDGELDDGLERVVVERGWVVRE